MSNNIVFANSVVNSSRMNRFYGSQKMYQPNSSENMEDLKTNGFVIIPCLAPDKLPHWKRRINQTLLSMPEYKPHDELLPRYVMGGFSALGNPSSFHNNTMRTLRQIAHVRCVKDVFRHFLEIDENLKFEQVIDRFMFRPAGASPSTESWHRDESKFAEDSDTIFGGWLNLDDEDQYLSCVPGTHTQASKNKGFATISDNAQIELFNPTKKRVRIPPGHILIFYERMVHEVVAGKKKFDMYRLFLGWRLTYSSNSLIEGLGDLLDNQSIIPIKSGQLPPMYSKMHWNFPRQRDALEKFSTAFKDAILTQRIVQRGNDAGRSYSVVPLHMSSLNEMQLDMYPEYTELELAMYSPASLDETFRIVSQIQNELLENDSSDVQPMPEDLDSSDSDDSDMRLSDLLLTNTRRRKFVPPQATGERVPRPRLGVLGSISNPVDLRDDDDDSDEMENAGTYENPIILD